MEPWPRSDVVPARMEGLVKKGLLRARTEAAEWLIPGGEDVPSSPDGFFARKIGIGTRMFLKAAT